MAKPRLLIIGGGVAGLTLAIKSGDFADVTLVDRKDYFELTWATVRGVVDDQTADRMSFPYSSVPKLGKVIKGTVVELRPKSARLDSGIELEFDFAAICVGTEYADKFARTTSSTKGERLTELAAYKQRIKAAKNIVVVGGGPAGVETAAEIVEAFAGKSVTLVHPATRLLDAKPEKLGNFAKGWLEQHGVKVVLGCRGSQSASEPGVVSLSDGTRVPADLVIWCIGNRLNTTFLRAQLASILDEKGAVKVNDKLQVAGQPHIFALGDCNDLKEFKVGFLAAQQAELTAANLKALIAGKSLKAWKVNGGMEGMFVSLGRYSGTGHLGSCKCNGLIVRKMKSEGLFIEASRKRFGVKG